MAMIQTATLAEIFAQQGHWERAVGIYRALLDVEPSRQDWRDRLVELEVCAEKAADAAARQDRLTRLKTLLRRVRSRRVSL